MAKQVTLADVALESQLSPSTVSLVLRNKPGIPDETRQRVLDAARLLGYKQQKAGALSIELNSTVKWRSHAGKTTSFGLIVKTQPDITPQANPFYSHVLAGIADACRRAQINLLYALVPVDDHNLPTETPQLLNEDHVDGLLFVGAFMDKTLDHILQQRHHPVILVDAYSESGMHDAVVSDNLRGGFEAVSYLIQGGHRHIGIIGSQSNAYPSILERRNGYLQALATHSITDTYFGDSTFEKEDLANTTRILLQQNPQISALFCCNDAAAIVAMRTAQELGRAVPSALSVIGFDDIDLAQHVTPTLTTMQVDKIKMGRAAVQLLSDRIQFPYSAQTTLLLRPQLITRESVIRIPAIK